MGMSIDSLPPIHSAISMERISELQTRWNEALSAMAEILYPEDSSVDSPEVLAYRSQIEFARQPDTKLLLGIAGPGAAGKGTLGRFLTDALGYEKIVNSTTREPRESEVHGVDYYFMTPKKFSRKELLGKFALSLERPGRGMYGIKHKEIKHKLKAVDTGCIFEENPENILRAFDDINEPAVQRALLYVLPASPVMEKAIGHLQHRLSLEQDLAKQMLTPEVFESTLGDRQIDEFLALSKLPDHPGIAPIFLINDNLEEAKQTLTQLLRR